MGEYIVRLDENLHGQLTALALATEIRRLVARAEAEQSQGTLLDLAVAGQALENGKYEACSSRLNGIYNMRPELRPPAKTKHGAFYPVAGYNPLGDCECETCGVTLTEFFLRSRYDGKVYCGPECLERDHDDRGRAMTGDDAAARGEGP